MTKWAHADVLDNGLNHIKNNCDKVILTSAYAAGDSFATVVAATLAEAAMSAPDFVLGNGAAGARALTSAAGVQDAAANATGGGAAMHICFVDTINSKVLWVTDETSDQTITLGNPVTFPSLVYTSTQPG